MQSSASTLFSAYASLAASMMLVRSMANEIIPNPVRSYIQSAIHYLFTLSPLSSPLSSTSTADSLVIKSTKPQRYTSAPKSAPTLSDSKFTKLRDRKNLNISIQKKRREKVLSEYLPFVLAKYKEIKDNDKEVKLYAMNCLYDYDEGGGGGVWGSVKLEHPSTFETLAMDKEMKKAIIDDLERFVKRKEFYKKVGRAWKRGYLLYGPPGTGKSSLIAAMANYLKFDIYDLELTNLYSNSELRRILVSTTNRSIIVIEDIDCSAEMQERQLGNDSSNTKLTLSGLLNFIDGLWSSCGDERIIVFTTNHKDRLDPALLRPGRMDMHIHMSYCTTQGFRLLATNYLGLGDPHRLFGEIESLIENVQATPAEIAEELMKSDDADIALGEVVNFLKRKKSEANNIEEEKNLALEAHDNKQKKTSGAEKEAKRMKTEKIANRTLRNCMKRSTRGRRHRMP
ncbi:unnamed protein product [Ilex paraguariensis]|uniref:AAA+ ATPase domain-containing protein n=1 Tax=Ilex paraguariensis TaxID=185542 RepID=A0ABC8QZ13_9AQUA